MNKKHNDFDATAFPSFDYGHTLPPKILPTKIKSHEIRACLSASIYMATQIELTQGSTHLRPEKIRGSYFRAALSELVRIEDLTSKLQRSFYFQNTPDPLLHIIKLLRNYEVHIGANELKEGSIIVNLAGEESIYSSFIVCNLSAEELKTTRNGDKYTNEQITELINLFDINQRKFGVVQLLYNSCIHLEKILTSQKY